MRDDQDQRDHDPELDPKAKRLVAAARTGRTPNEADKRRVGAALAAALAAGTATGAATGVSAAKVAGGLAGLRGALAVLLVASTGAGVAWWTHGKTKPPQAPAAVAPAPVVITPLPPAAVPPASDDPLLAEVKLLRQAERALHDGQPARALELAGRHEAQYPKSQVSVERDGLRVFALCALGRKAEARAVATELLARAPRSPLRASLAESCAMK